MSSKFRTVFLGTPDIAAHCLQALIDDEHFDVVGVVSQPDRPAGRKLKLTPSPVKLLAEAQGIPCITPNSVNTPETLEQLKNWEGQCAVVVAFGQLMKQDFLDLYPEKVVNVHASLLPRWRGAAPIQRAIMAGDSETGCSLQVMQLKLDAGDVIGKRKTPILKDMTALELLNKMKTLAAELLIQDFLDFLRGMLTPQPQDESQVTYASKLLKAEARLDWNQSASEIDRFVRGFTMGPGAYTEILGKKLKLHQVKPSELKSSKTPGAVEKVDSDRLFVACADGTVLELKTVQPENKAKMSAGDYLRGHAISEGDLFQ